MSEFRHTPSDQAPEPRQVEWDTPYPAFAPETIAELRQALRRMPEYDPLGIDVALDIEGYGTQGFPEARTQMRLPDGTEVNAYLHVETLPKIKEESSGSDRTAPWGAEIRAHVTRTGGIAVDNYPLVLSADWASHGSEAPQYTATFTANGVDVPFSPVSWDYLEEDDRQIGGLQPASVAQDEIAITLVPGTAEFAESLNVTFHQAQNK